MEHFMNNIRETSFYGAESLCFLAERFFFDPQNERPAGPGKRL
jgi:hypothetical protein